MSRTYRNERKVKNSVRKPKAHMLAARNAADAVELRELGFNVPSRIKKFAGKKAPNNWWDINISAVNEIVGEGNAARKAAERRKRKARKAKRDNKK